MTTAMRCRALLVVLLVSEAARPVARAQDGAPADAEELAKQLANPVASLISVPLQSNYDFDIGSDDGFRYTLDFEPVIPFELDERWNLISRTIVPVIYEAGTTPGSGDQFGLGDVMASLFFSPKEPTAGGLIWGIGPALLLPTATRDRLGTDQWAAGPTGLVLKQQNEWTFGLLVSHVWTITGDEDRNDVTATFAQPFLNHTRGSVTYGVNFEGTYDWETERWTLPMNLFRNQVMSIGSQRVSIGGGLKFYVDAPEGAPDWGIRVNVTLLYPK